ncbi:MAG: alkene reductase [Gammaproteobacteria bacterium]|nr:alkene reductase [Gammaproteobacteria bacterium]MDE2345984.1 alkene reductase [Gammaproteobacteria bacterium]
MNKQDLLTAVRLGPYTLPNRVVMAPMTRSRAYNRDRAPTELHAEYYAQRASAGLIITEGSQISPQAVGYVYTPGIHTQAQIRGWEKVTAAVHAREGRIFLQLWHVGYVSHPDFHDAQLPVAPSAINPNTQSFTLQGLKDTVTARALETSEVRSIVQDYVQAAINAMLAGFDGVEIHGANGYLIEQFLRDGSNRRTDAYGGAIPNRARFLFEIVEAVSEAVGSERVGVRLSPANTWNVPADTDTRSLYDFVIGELSGYQLAYLHLREAQGDLSGIPNMVTDVSAHYRRVYHGTLITNTGYDRQKGDQAVANGQADLVAFGVPFISNPDLVERFRLHAPLAQADQATFYQGGAKGYVDYPVYQAAAA